MNCDCKKGSRFRVLVGLISVVTIICLLVSILTTLLLVERGDWSQHDTEHGHLWLHSELDLSDSEASAIDILEPDYRLERAKLEKNFQEQILLLREMIVYSNELTPEISHAIHELHIVHGQLQELSIEHYFQMMDTLPKDKQIRLRKIASQALSIPE